MKTVRKILIFLVVVIGGTSILLVVFRDRVKVVFVRTIVQRWTNELLRGAALSEKEKEDIAQNLGEFYALAVDKVIPEKKVEDIWEYGRNNLGLWYFYMKNYFKDIVDDSGIDVKARKKAKAVIDKFVGYIKDGRVRPSHLKELNSKVDVFVAKVSPKYKMKDEDIHKAVNNIDNLNDRLEKEGPGDPVDPEIVFNDMVEKVQSLIKKYKQGHDSTKE